MTESESPQAPPPPTPPAGVPAWISPAEGEVITAMPAGNTYTMGAVIGEGNFGIVYACVDVWRNDLAAKVLKPTAPPEHLRAAAEAELKKLIHLRHPHVTYVYDAFEFRGAFYIITERCYCPLWKLFSYPDFNGVLWILPIARSLLQAVHYLHSNHFAHQDIHPGNVFAAFARDEMAPGEPGAMQFRLGDLGVSKVFAEQDAMNTLADCMRPPEAIDPKEFGPVDGRLDIYHLGLLFLQLATSRLLQFTREEILAGAPRDMALTLPPPFNFALEKALRRHVAFRTATAMELWRDLNAPGAASVDAEVPAGAT